MSLGEYIGAGSGTTKLLLHLNGSSADSSGNNNNGTDTAIIYSQANGKFGQGAGFNGSSSRIATGITGFPTGANARTLSMWVYKTTTDVDVSFGYGKSTAPYTSSVFGFFINNTRINFWAYADDVDTGVDITLNKWENIIFTYDGTTIIPYLNGKAGSPITKTLNTTAQVSFLGVNGFASANYWHGGIDEIILENRAWSASEVKKYYSASKGRWANL